jgi:hypothetical protein
MGPPRALKVCIRFLTVSAYTRSLRVLQFNILGDGALADAMAKAM